MIDDLQLMTQAEQLRNKLGKDNHSPVDIFSLVQGIEKMTIVYYPMGNRLSGMCIKGSEGKCTIALNSSMTLGRQRFSLAHELYHRFYDENRVSVCVKSIGTGNETEKMADAFAAYFLMPRAALADKVEELLNKHEGELTLQDVICLEQYFGVSHQAMLYQLHHCGYIDRAKRNELCNIGVKRQAAMMGFSSALYCPSSPEKQYCTYGYYLHQVKQLFNRDIISDGKYEELLLDAFRDDLVYDDMGDGGEMLD